MTDDSAYDTIHELGKFGKLHIVDLSSSDLQSDTMMYYKKRVANCDMYLNKLVAFRLAMQDHQVQPPGSELAPMDLAVGDVLEAVKRYVDPLEEEYVENLRFKTVNLQLINELKEREFTLRMCNHIVREAQQARPGVAALEHKGSLNASELDTPLLEEGLSPSSPVNQFSNTICGVIPSDKQLLFERVLFRLTRGNAIMTFQEIPEAVIDPSTAQPVNKTVFTIVFIGHTLKTRIIRTCQSFGATRYDVPTDRLSLDAALADIQSKLSEYHVVLDKTVSSLRALLSSLAIDRSGMHSPLLNWSFAVSKEKAICEALRKCRVDDAKSKLLTLEGWVPTLELPALRQTLSLAVSRSQAQQAVCQVVPLDAVHMAPPTYLKTDKFTEAFQGIVDTYGVPRYREVNPGLFTVVTFPFLFGVMYGDIGHGLMLFAFGLFLVLSEKTFEMQKKAGKMNEILSMAYGGRYVLLLMGIFAVYCGTIYNDCMSIAINAFGTNWHFPSANAQFKESNGHVYPYGVDPSWYNTNNELMFMNSFKMKLAVTLGVLQMMFGIGLSLANHIHFRSWVGICFEFIPRVAFLVCTFGYMIFIIIYKFTQDWTGREIYAPNLVQTMIGMFLSPGSVDADKQLYEGQAKIQAILLVIAFISVPLMLLPGPIITHYRAKQAHKKSQEAHYAALEEKSLDVPSPVNRHHGAAAAESHGDEHHSFGDLMIHQSIHTIEFVLGTVSNTASYLRLWALSLAHSELATVFWSKMIMQYGINTGSPIMTFVGFGVWFCATAAVLLAMDVLECFLHALRLHWVEFQNKFYQADGYAFDPFNFKEKEESS